MSVLIVVAALLLVAAILWFFLAAVAELVPSWKVKARQHERVAAKVGGVALVSIIVLTVAAPKGTDEAATPQVAALEEDASEPIQESDDLGTATGEIARPTPRPVADPEPEQVAEAASDTSTERRELLPTQEARLMCRAMDSTGLGSAPCEYSGWNSTITLTIDMVASEARQLCQQLVTYSRENRMGLSGWTLHIRSPYSGTSSIAFCQLA